MSDTPWWFHPLPTRDQARGAARKSLRALLLFLALLGVHLFLSRQPTVSGIEEAWLLFGLWVCYVAKHNLIAAAGDLWYVIANRQNGGKRIAARGGLRTALGLMGIVFVFLGWGILAAMRPPAPPIPGTPPAQIVSPLLAIFGFAMVAMIVFGESHDRKSLLAIFDIIYKAKPSAEHVSPGKD
jgi:hypothetical protein